MSEPYSNESLAILTIVATVLIIIIVNYSIFSANTDFTYSAAALIGVLCAAVISVDNLNRGITGGAVKKKAAAKPRSETATKKATAKTAAKSRPETAAKSTDSDDKFAYVWCVTDAHKASRTVISMYSVAATKTKYDLVAMVTADMPAATRELLNISGIVRLIEVPPLKYRLKTGRTSADHDTMIFTKWNCLNLIDYKKVLYLDSNALILGNIDHLFDLRAPAAPFDSTDGLLSVIRAKTNERGGFAHGAKIHFKGVDMALRAKTKSDAANAKNIVAAPNCVLISPSRKDYDLFTRALGEMQPFGFQNCESPFDMQAICYFYSIVKQFHWANIAKRYNTQYAPAAVSNLTHSKTVHNISHVDDATEDIAAPYTAKEFPYIFVCDNDTSILMSQIATAAAHKYKVKEYIGEIQLHKEAAEEPDIFLSSFNKKIKTADDAAEFLKPEDPLFVQPENFVPRADVDVEALKTERTATSPVSGNSKFL
jgi:hypothetical protein